MTDFRTPTPRARVARGARRVLSSLHRWECIVTALCMPKTAREADRVANVTVTLGVGLTLAAIGFRMGAPFLVDVVLPLSALLFWPALFVAGHARNGIARRLLRSSVRRSVS